MSELVYSHKPEVLRLHEIEEQERSKFCGDFSMVLNELLPAKVLRKIRASKIVSRLLAVCPDAFYTLVTTLKTRRRLGQEYTYIAMFKSKHYEQEGVLLNKNIRILLSVLQLLSRHVVIPTMVSTIDKKMDQGGNKDDLQIMWGKIQSAIVKYVGTGDQILSNLQWLMLMLFMLNWNKRYTIIESLLGISYVYTYKNEGLKDISYKIEGYLILATLIIKLLKHAYAIYKQNKAQKSHKKVSSIAMKPTSISEQGRKVPQKKKDKVLCRICYDDMKSRSATKCGHIFCWECIIQTLEMTEECPVCRTQCLPREVVQLRNY